MPLPSIRLLEAQETFGRYRFPPSGQGCRRPCRLGAKEVERQRYDDVAEHSRRNCAAADPPDQVSCQAGLLKISYSPSTAQA